MALILAASYDLEVLPRMAQALELRRHSVVATSTVNQALQWLEQTKEIPQLIIADVGLRAFGGLEFLQRLKANQKWSAIQILAQTKSNRSDIFELCGVVVNKPWSNTELIMAVDLILALNVPATLAKKVLIIPTHRGPRVA